VLGQHRRQDVGLVVVSQRAEDIHVFDVLFEHELAVGGVAVEHDRSVERLGELARAIGAELDELDPILVLEALGEATPCNVLRSNLSCRSCKTAALMSTMVRSSSSEARLSATDEPAWPAPRMMIFMAFVRGRGVEGRARLARRGCPDRRVAGVGSARL